MTTAERLAYSVAEAAEALGVSENHVRKIINDRQLRAVKLGARTVIPATALRDMLGESEAGRD